METTIPRRRRARVFSVGAAIALVALLLPVTAGVASAHNYDASLGCVSNQPVLTVSLSSYNGSYTNSVTITIDSVLDSADSKSSFGTTYTLTKTLSPATASHTAVVAVVAGDNSAYSHTFNLSVSACQTPPPPAHLTLIKIVSGGTANATDWTLSAVGTTPLSGTSPVSGNVTAGTYTLSESTGPANYVAGAWDCKYDVTLTASPASVSNSVSLNPGDSKTCTITNTYVPPTLPTPTINTTQQPASAVVGSSIADKATVSGGYNPTGTVTFNLYNNSAGTGTPLFTDANVALVSGVATSAGYTASATGTDYWVATYNGDSNNNPVTSGAASEPVSIVPPKSPPCTTANGCSINTPPPTVPPNVPTPTPNVSTPTPTPNVSTPTPTSSVEAATSSPTGTVEAATSKPHVTPPPTSALGGTPGGPAGGTGLVLLALAGLLASILFMTQNSLARVRSRR